MKRAELLTRLKDYIVTEVLEGRAEGLETTSPLLEWGVLNSFHVVRMLRFLREDLQIHIPPDRITAASLKNLECIADLIEELGATDAAAENGK